MDRPRARRLTRIDTGTEVGRLKVELLITIIVGGLVGWLASLVMGTSRQMGLIANVVVGIVGASLGHWPAPKAGLVPADSIAQWLVSIGGAVALILILKAIGIYK